MPNKSLFVLTITFCMR